MPQTARSGSLDRLRSQVGWVGAPVLRRSSLVAGISSKGIEAKGIEAKGIDVLKVLNAKGIDVLKVLNAKGIDVLKVLMC